jgi:TM2 domain-containing membrane protein YozV
VKSCANCGHENPPDYSFCMKCGHALISGSPPAGVTDSTPAANLRSSSVADKSGPESQKANGHVTAVVRCPYCAEEILAEAKKCKHCGELIGAKKCPFCSQITPVDAVKCGHCSSPLLHTPLLATQSHNVFIDAGVGLRQPKRISASNPPRSPAIMALLCFLIAGLGQMVLGQVMKGVVILVLTILISIPMLGLGLLIFCPLSAIDAYKIAKKLRAGQTVGEWEFF